MIPDQNVYLVARFHEKSKTCNLLPAMAETATYFVPASRNAVKKKKDGDDAAGEVEAELRDVRPDDGFHSAFERVKNCEGDDDEDGETLAGAKRCADY